MTEETLKFAKIINGMNDFLALFNTINSNDINKLFNTTHTEYYKNTFLKGFYNVEDACRRMNTYITENKEPPKCVKEVKELKQREEILMSTIESFRKRLEILENK